MMTLMLQRDAHMSVTKGLVTLLYVYHCISATYVAEYSLVSCFMRPSAVLRRAKQVCGHRSGARGIKRNGARQVPAPTLRVVANPGGTASREGKNNGG